MERRRSTGSEFEEGDSIPSVKKLREAMIELASSELGHPLSPLQIMHVDFRLPEIMLAFDSPNHPPYSQMIHRAIEALDEEGGSSRERISDYIKSHFQELPCAHHDSILSYHLEKLVSRGEILLTNPSNFSFSLIPEGRRGRPGKR